MSSGLHKNSRIDDVLSMRTHCDIKIYLSS